MEVAILDIPLLDKVNYKNRFLSPKELEDLRAGRSYLAVFGIVQYFDQFGPHWYRFCAWHGYNQTVPVEFAAINCVNWNQVGDGDLRTHH
ncbi:hypothetical protein ACPOL_7044 (plasmid) [Acidisarcina polymorpha]|uniref:Uncharacterized protein n=2 Tax=Acidisarcina polymorpha TaxID=2211140 RepID=A0A2Z5GBZ4_9BACT|nr:hypothetical protein ACPOL_7044 [Acidisarcina polymorpha]